MDNPKEYLKEPQRKEKFSLKNLHEKWKRKGNVNFNPIDYKFDFKKSPSVKKLHKTEEEENNKNSFLIYCMAYIMMPLITSITKRINHKKVI